MSGSTSPERNEKLAGFLKDCLAVGCLRGFYYFELYCRGREELLVTVKAGVDGPVFPSPSSNTIPVLEGGLPPASPCAKDSEQMSQDAVFLIGGYARYKCPFVWVRSNHTQLLGPEKQSSKDTPLDLKTTANWKYGDIKVWDIIGEIVLAIAHPPSGNPFKIDFGKLESMPLLDRTLAAGALAFFFRRMNMKNYPYSEEILNDTQKLLDLHFANLPLVLTS